MSVTELTQIPVEIFGGLVTNIDPADLPPGVSPDCADVAFKPGVPGTVQTRPGMTLIVSPIASAITYIATYRDLQGNNRGIFFDNGGTLWQEFPQGTFTAIGSTSQQSPFGYAKSVTAFGSEFIAFSDGKFGLDIPRRYTASTEGNTYDRLSQVGPGAAPTVVSGAAGSISAGVHKFSVVFITRNGYFTAPGVPPTSWTAPGATKANLSNIAIGPANVIARLIVATPAGGNDYYFSQSAQLGITTFLIPDNTSTTFTVDFTDLALISSTSADLLFDRIELPEVAGVIQFVDRIFAWGGRNRIENFINMPFDGGVLVLGGYPLGWVVDGGFGGGGSTQASSQFGFEYLIGYAAGNKYGMIEQGAWRDYLGVAILSPLKNYSLRVRLYKSGSTPGGNFVVDFFSPTNGVLATATIPINTVGVAPYQEFIVAFNATTPATIPADTILRLYVDATGGGTGTLHVDNVEVFPQDQPFNTSVLYASNAADPEAFQGVTGFENVNENDGYRLTSLFVVRERLYMLKSTAGLFNTTDDPSSEPSGWSIDTISRRVGAESINSTGVHIGTTGEDWAFIVSREGLYIFWASEPPKISQEIQPTWNQINWNFGFQTWIAVDTKERRLLVGCPMGSSTVPNKVLQMDYKAIGETAEAVASGAPVRPTYAGQEKAHASGRKWSPWTFSVATVGFPFFGSLLERNDGQAHITIGAQALFLLDEANTTDNGAAIPGGGYYVTSAYPSEEQAQTMQFKGNRALERYMTLAVDGFGAMQIECLGPGFVNTYIAPIPGAPALVLSNPSSKDMETYLNFGAERIFNKVTNLDMTAPFWSMKKMTLYLSADPVLTIRGNN
jgi:hypothetical protein